MLYAGVLRNSIVQDRLNIYLLTAKLIISDLQLLYLC